MKDDCIFCKIAGGVIPANALYEDDDFKVIFDLGPASKGHVLILPKEHFDNVFEMTDEYAAKVFVLAKKVATAIKKTFKCDGVNILQNNGSVAGQTVFHFHMHIIPRYEGDGVNVGWNPGSISPEQIAEYVEQVRANMN